MIEKSIFKDDSPQTLLIYEKYIKLCLFIWGLMGNKLCSFYTYLANFLTEQQIEG